MRLALTRWYDCHRRDLPWRRTRDPYAIWISEIMLQQTRVAAVIPYYERFLRAFPNARALAAAPEQRVLTMWSGLGYYSRARNLQKAAFQMVSQISGPTKATVEFPRDYESIRALAGVGDYTAAAISSIAFSLPYAAVDGNARRVIVRLLNNDDADVPAHASRLLDRHDPGRWNQAMMELGATTCTPRDPRCGECPIVEYCEAHKHGTHTWLPSKRVKPAPEQLTRTLLIVRRGGRILLRPSARVRGFWDLPEAGSFTGVEMQVPGIRPGQLLGSFRHTITHRHYKFIVRKGIAGKAFSSKPATAQTGERYRWVAHPKLHEIPLSTTAKKGMRCLEG